MATRVKNSWCESECPKVAERSTVPFARVCEFDGSGSGEFANGTTDCACYDVASGTRDCGCYHSEMNSQEPTRL